MERYNSKGIEKMHWLVFEAMIIVSVLIIKSLGLLNGCIVVLMLAILIDLLLD
jgi:hypothetical protein